MLFNNYKKWSLFCVLAGSLGFSLSMNPAHYNNIVRYEKDALQSIAFASSSEVQKVSGSSREVLVGTQKGNFKAKVYSVDDATFVRFEKLGETEGKSCDLCGKTFSLNADVKDISALNTELMKIANADQKEEKSEDGEKVIAQKKGEATEVDIEEWAAKCEKIESSNAKLNCHRKSIIELSKYLKNSSDTASYIQDYFSNYLKADILAGFINPTVKTSPFGSQSFSFDEDFDSGDGLAQSNELAEELIKGLQAKNGKSTIEVLVKMRAASFTAQLRHSQNLMIQGINESNPRKFQMGMQGMQPDVQRSILQQSTESMLSAVSSMKASSSEKSYFSQYVTNNMFAPVDNVLNQFKTHILNNQTQTTGANGQIQSNWVTFTIPALGEPYTTTILTSPGIVPDTSLAAMIRQGSQSRGQSIEVPTQWGTGQGALNNNGLVTLPSPLNSNQQVVPLVGRTARQ